MPLINALKRIFSTIRVLDQTNLRLFQILSPEIKISFVRRFFDLFAPLLVQRPIKLNGLSVYVPSRLFRYYGIQEFEPEIRRIMERDIQPGMVVVDIGANIGCHTLFMAQNVGRGGKVYAVEPGLDNLEFLQKNIQLNGFTNIEVLPYATGEKNQLREFYLHESSTMHSFYTSPKDIVKTVLVQEVRLDDIIKDKVDFVKIDIEGSEIETLKGMKNILQSNPELRLLVEWNPQALQKVGYSVEALPEFLMKLGFSVFVINDEEQSHCCEIEKIMKLFEGGFLDNLWHTNLYAK
jgi:FkbM family methyltransferase